MLSESASARPVSRPLLYLWLSTLPGLSVESANQLLEHFGSPEAIYAADRRQLSAGSNCKASQLDALAAKSLDTAKRIVEQCEQKQVQIITQGDRRYPQCLRTIDNPPLALYVRGTWQDFDRVPAITVIGTRNASAYGLSISEQLGYMLGKAGFTVLSGMALGNDGAAHRGALRAGGRTMAVLADSPDLCFPPQHAALMQDILVSGAVISETPPGGSCHKPNYHMRNRILSGLAIAVVIVEASARRSGTSITAHHAANQGRDVYAVPGAINAAASAGCNEMIACGDAMILTRLDSLLQLYRSQLPEQSLPLSQPIVSADPITPARSARASRTTTPPKGRVCSPEQQRILMKQKQQKTASSASSAPPVSRADLTAEEQQIIALIQQGVANPNDLVEQGGLPSPTVMSLLTMLEMKGIITLQNGRFVYLP